MLRLNEMVSSAPLYLRLSGGCQQRVSEAKKSNLLTPEKVDLALYLGHRD